MLISGINKTSLKPLLIPTRRLQVIFLVLLVSMLVACGQAVSVDSLPVVSATPTLQVRSSDGMTMVFVPGATFELAEAGGRKGRHAVTLSEFWIDQTEVNNSQYEQCTQAGACQPATTCAWGEPTFNNTAYANHPVICVTWQMAQVYCTWAGGRLPTEAEWDYAARGPQRYLYSWGDVFNGTRLNFCDVNCPNSDIRDLTNDDGYAKTAPVGSYPSGASWCGALDMGGNVWEWVADWYGPYTSDAETNPTGPPSGDERVIRGGSWYDDSDFVRADHRHPFDPRDYNHLIGFRCVVPIEAGAP